MKPVMRSVLALIALLVAACTPALGGATHPREGTEVVPAPSRTVCVDGMQPPCE